MIFLLLFTYPFIISSFDTFLSPTLAFCSISFSLSFCFLDKLISISSWYFFNIFSKLSCSLSNSFSFMFSYYSTFFNCSVAMSFRVRGVAWSCPTVVMSLWDWDLSKWDGLYWSLGCCPTRCGWWEGGSGRTGRHQNFYSWNLFYIYWMKYNYWCLKLLRWNVKMLHPRGSRSRQKYLMCSQKNNKSNKAKA